MKKIISFILCAILVTSLFSGLPVSATRENIKFIDASTIRIREYDEDEELHYYDYYKIQDGVIYNYHSDWAEVVAILPEEENAKVVIPEKIVCQGKTRHVECIGLQSNEALKNALTTDGKLINSNVSEIVIPDSVYVVAGVCNAPNLKKVTIGKSVYNISNSFYNCENLELIIDGKNKKFKVEGKELYSVANGEKRLISVFDNPVDYEIKEGVTHFEAPFGRKNKTLKNLIIKNDILFVDAKGLKSLQKTEVKNAKINELKLWGNNNIASLDFSNVTIRKFSAKYLKNLTSLKLDEGVKQVDIEGCKSLSKINFPKSLKKINRNNFANTGFKKLTIPNSINFIGNYAFKGCKNLEQITLSDSITKIRANAFLNCKKLSKVVFESKKTIKVYKNAFKNTKNGIKFYVKTKKLAKELKANLKNSGVKNAKIYVGKSLIYSKIK